MRIWIHSPGKPSALWRSFFSVPWDVLHSDSSQINTISVNKHGRLENHPLSIFIQGIAFTFIFQPGILLEYRIFLDVGWFHLSVRNAVLPMYMIQWINLAEYDPYIIELIDHLLEHLPKDQWSIVLKKKRTIFWTLGDSPTSPTNMLFLLVNVAFPKRNLPTHFLVLHQLNKDPGLVSNTLRNLQPPPVLEGWTKHDCHPLQPQRL